MESSAVPALAGVNKSIIGTSLIVVMGGTGAGKSFFINKLVGEELVAEGGDLSSCTQECQLVPAKIGQTKYLLLDTPGFDDTHRSDAAILKDIARALTAHHQQGIKIRGIIYMHKITDNRFTGTSRHTIDILKEICGNKTLGNVLLVTNRWDGVSESQGAAREQQLRGEHWADMIEHGSHIHRFDGTMYCAQVLINEALDQSTMVPDLVREIVDGRKELASTQAGMFIDNALKEKKKSLTEENTMLEQSHGESVDNNTRKRRIEANLKRGRNEIVRVSDQERLIRYDVFKAVEEESHEDTRYTLPRFTSFTIRFIPFAIRILGRFTKLIPDGSEQLADNVLKAWEQWMKS